MPKKLLDPLPSAAFQILLALADGDSHGYGIMRHVAEQTSGRMRLGPGTLYSSIQSLLEAGCIEEVECESSDRRRCYRLTSAGRTRVRDEVERLEELLRVARSKKLLEDEYA
jgi:DNA-binding PadR family transcriptional regulator